MTNLVPLGICAAFVFALMLTVTNKDSLASRFGFSASNVVASSSALFFVIMVAHIQLRREFPGETIVYMEKFSFVMYFVLVGVVANTYLFSMNHPWKIVQYRDNLIPKLTCWPVILIAANWITYFSF